MKNDLLPKSISQSKEPHKFFEVFLENDLKQLETDLVDRYKKIQNAELVGVSQLKDDEAWKSSNSVSTMKWREYNVFQFYTSEIRKLYSAVSKMTKEACEHYGIDFEKEQFMLQGWFNINEANKGKLNWHEHGPGGAPLFHGYYCVSAEPSETHYVVFDNEVKNVNINNRAILSEMGHPHAMGDWSWPGPRITIAYDVMPLRDLMTMADYTQEQHWIPLD
jgi:hypothetical protein